MTDYTPPDTRDTLAAAITKGIDRGLRDVGADLSGCTPSLLSGWVIRELRAVRPQTLPLDDLTRTITHADHAWNEQTGDWDPINPQYARFLAEHIHAALKANQ